MKKDMLSSLYIAVTMLKVELEKLEVLCEIIDSKGVSTLEISVSELDVPVKFTRALKNNQIETVGNLIFKSKKELFKIKGFKKRGFVAVEECLYCMGISLPYWSK